MRIYIRVLVFILALCMLGLWAIGGRKLALAVLAAGTITSIGLNALRYFLIGR